MEEPKHLSGASYSCDLTTGAIEKYSELEWYSDCFVIYVDKMGTSCQISYNDRIYGNRVGLSHLGSFYQTSAEIFSDSFKDNFKFFGFSDTVLAVVPIEERNSISPDCVAKTAIFLFFELIKTNLPVRIFISRGNFGFHIFHGVIERSVGNVCPVYGSALLNAYQSEKQLGDRKIKCTGVFIDESAKRDLRTLDKVKTVDGDREVGLIDFEHYLEPTDFDILRKEIQRHIQLQTLEELQAKIFDRECGCGELNFQLYSSLPENKKSEVLEDLNEGAKKIHSDQKFMHPYYAKLLEAIEKREG